MNVVTKGNLMNDFRKRMLVAAVIAGFAVIGYLMSSQQAVAQGPPSGLAVNIVNPLPLPVTGSTTVSGTVAATQSGTWNVGVTGTPNVNVANPATAPVPVTLISPASSPSVTCTVTFNNGGGNGLPFTSGGQVFGPANLVKCPTGTSAIDVKRIIYDPDNTFTQNLAGYRTLLGFASTFLDSDPNATVLALFTEGSPEKTFTEPIRLDVTTVPGIAIKSACFSGLASANVTCGGGKIYFIGAHVR
jgi:hypothetical protein